MLNFHELRIKYPIFQAGMAGGVTTSRLVAAVSNYGAVGNIGAGYMTPEGLKESIVEIKSLTANPFGVNLFLPEGINSVSQRDIKAMRQYLNVNSDEEFTSLQKKSVNTFEKQLEVIINEKVAICSFTFGLPDSSIVKELKNAGIKVGGTATTVNEAVQLEENGVDFIIAQGSEAGGHRGTFPTTEGEPLIGTLSLVPQMIENVKTPVIAAGGIVNGKGINAAFVLGAVGVQLGSVFLTCHESGAHEKYKDKIIESNEENTILTKVFSGKLARGIRNEFIDKLMDEKLEIPPYPIQNELTKPLRAKASAESNPEYMSLWVGQGVGMIHKRYSVNELLNELVSELDW
ncbi:NAD(P)H-dependent flavin oxidoreductase [Bacillus sp. CGMCC 1.16607]|uniref:NAD(P)H-dependent flavin oxidoreductase n=1 Tax=Bacillus sp. CGMCC 1.16607 TaxID=3351842 RepID=UPI00363F2304